MTDIFNIEILFFKGKDIHYQELSVYQTLQLLFALHIVKRHIYLLYWLFFMQTQINGNGIRICLCVHLIKAYQFCS